MESAAKAGRLKDAERWFEERQKLECEEGKQSENPEGTSNQAKCISYYMLVDAAARAGDLQAAEGWLKRLGDKVPGADLRPAFNFLMSAAAGLRDMKTTYEWLKKMYASNISPDDMTFIAVAEKCVETGDVEAAEEWLKQAYPLASQVDFTSQVVLTAVRAGRKEGAERLLTRALACAPGSQASSLLCLASKEVVKMNLDSGNSEKAEMWLQKAHSAGCAEELRNMYLEMLKSAAFKGNLQKVEEVFRKARDFGFCDLQFFTAMVDAASKCKDLMAAERWFEEALDAGLEPDMILFTSMVDAASRLGDFRAAEYWLRRGESAGFEANKVMLSTLINGAARAKNKSKALEWAARALERFGSDLVILNSVLDAHAKLGEIREAEALLEKILQESSRLQPDERSFGPIINAHAEKGNFEEALQRFRQMVEVYHVPPSVIQYNQLLKACARCRPPLAAQAEEIFGELMSIRAEQLKRKFRTRDLEPTRITLKSLGRCVGARRLSQICEVGRSC